jgi:glutaminyl-peptide cyclotransferase
MNHFFKLILFSLSFFIFSCQEKPKQEDKSEDTQIKKAVLPNNFNSDSAYVYIAKQVSFGPRVPNTESHRKCALWIESTLKKWADTIYIQAFDAKNYKGDILKAKNIIGSFNPKNRTRIVLAAHWDTRPQADQDALDKSTPSDGANDGGSGVGVLLEIARQLHLNKPTLGIDIIFFDVEDGGANNNDIPDTWCLGSQYWSEHKHVPDYMATNGILLDMVGAKNATFAREGGSAKFDNDFLGLVWQTGVNLGYGSYFIDYMKQEITDDHFYMSTKGGVPTIDIIEYSPQTNSGFGAYWHTHNDNMSIIDKQTLTAVGRTVLQVVFDKDANQTIEGL